MKPTTEGAQVRLADTHRLDARGGWQGESPGRSENLDLRLVSEKGQWRIDNPLNALVVPTSFFDRSFARFNLYFYDQTGRGNHLTQAPGGGAAGGPDNLASATADPTIIGR